MAQGHHFIGRAEHEFARVQDEWLIGVDLDQAGELVLLHRRVDVRILVVVEKPEEPVKSNIHGRGLDHRRLEGLQPDLT
ncbi:hypothetical protein GCM10017709_20420 [Glutamicibacter nicotianae]|uniref:Uncharacterized protein n=1 Tax=Glutamicibacter nicotianae TaxID=37929 RepID=A0ABQ0RNK8_GLUNI|nr:hypothetical protein ANI01nite_26040 [Glutamicibacter nicotianae]